MKHLTISSTSNLLENNDCWQQLSKEVNLEFTGYGDITSGLLSNSENGLVIVLFLEDLTQNIFEDYALVEEANKEFFKLVENRAKRSKQPIIFCLGSRSQNSVITISRNYTKLKKFYDWLINNIIKLRNTFETIYFINLNDIFYHYGSMSIFSDRNWYFARCRLSARGLSVLSKKIESLINRITTPAKKVLVLDCDNTLWGGVIAEDGIKGLVIGQDGLGQAFVDFQKECLRLSQEGVLLALASKNNEEDVWSVFDNHPSMILKRNNIVTAKINWDEKSSNLEKIAFDLDLGTDSFVFWDDNPIEQNKVKTIMPEVLTINAPKNVIEWPYLIKNLDCFAKLSITSEDKKKSEQYQLRAQFKSDTQKADDINSYLSTINLTPTLIYLNDTNITRAEQMCKKTNQFNLRTIKYSSSELNNNKNQPDKVFFMVKLTDSYGDHGLIALVGLSYLEDNIAFLDTFLMSCRVLGRHLEAWILNEIFTLTKKNNCKKLIANFIDSGKNKIAKDFLVKYGFKRLVDNKCVHKLKSKNYYIKGELHIINVNTTQINNLEIFKRGKNVVA